MSGWKRFFAATLNDDGRFRCCVIRTLDAVLFPAARKAFRALKAEIDATMRATIEAAVAADAGRPLKEPVAGRIVSA